VIGYVIRRTTDGAYVARPGSRGSYTGALQLARVYSTREAARRDFCVENEVVISIEEAMGVR